jgi:hypothetical protein
MKTLFLAWQATRRDRAGEPASRRWYPVGRLDGDEGGAFRFRYMHGAEIARDEAGFQPLDAFPELGSDYRSQSLFALFNNRVPNPKRADYGDVLERLGLPRGTRDPFSILAVSGGRRQTDHLEVFPSLEKAPNGSFSCRFCVHGSRHVSEAAQERLMSLTAGERLQVALELNNPASGVAVQLQTSGEGEYHMLGWAPRYLVDDLVSAMAAAPAQIYAKVVRVNAPPAPSSQRLLVELGGLLPANHDPMSGPEFQPLASHTSH